MKRPLLQDDAFLADIAAVSASGSPATLHLWWLGQSGFLIQCMGRRLLLDPYLSDSLTVKYAETDKPHVRMTERVIDPARLEGIALVTSSHNHTDHLDGETLGPVLAANPHALMIAPEANKAFVRERVPTLAASRLLVLDDGEVIGFPSLSITAVPAAHETVERDASERCKFLGYVIRIGAWTLYHSGDTVFYDGMVELLRGHGVDIALLPINGRAPERRVAGNLSGVEAARLAFEIGAKLVVPCHYDLFTFNTADPADAFVPECERLGQSYRVLQNGERLTLSAPA